MNKANFTADKNKLIITRDFDAPLNLVWKAWTDPELLDQWWAPKPWKSRTKHMDFREGGYRLYAMVGPEGEEHWGRSDYKSIIHHKSFSGDDAFCDEEGNTNDSMPVAHFVNKFTEKPGQTEVSITTEYATEADLEKVIQMGMQEGLTMTLDSLEELLKELTNKS